MAAEAPDALSIALCSAAVLNDAVRETFGPMGREVLRFQLFLLH